MDTIILVYAVDQRAGTKREIAADIVARSAENDCVLTLQALSEFYAVVTRKSRMSPREAAAQVEDWLVLFPILPATPAAVRAALTTAASGRASYWDALLVATAGEGGCGTVLSENMKGGARLGTVLIVGPFNGQTISDAAARLIA